VSATRREDIEKAESIMSDKKLEDKDVTPAIALEFINAALIEAKKAGVNYQRVTFSGGAGGIVFGVGVEWRDRRLVVKADEVGE